MNENLLSARLVTELGQALYLLDNLGGRHDMLLRRSDVPAPTFDGTVTLTTLDGDTIPFSVEPSDDGKHYVLVGLPE